MAIKFIEDWHLRRTKKKADKAIVDARIEQLLVNARDRQRHCQYLTVRHIANNIQAIAENEEISEKSYCEIRQYRAM